MKPRLIYDQFGQAYVSYWYALDPLGGVRRMQVRFGLDLSQTYRRVERW